MTAPNLIPFQSLLLRDLVSTEAMRSVWTEENLVGKWIEVERTITESQAELEMIPKDAAADIVDALTPEKLTIARIKEKREQFGHLMVSFLKAFREVCGPAAEHFHVGPTTQDIFDTGLTLQIREAHQIILNQMIALESALCDRAIEHAETIVMGRSHQKHAVPVTFGFVLASWATEISDHIERARESEKRWMLGNLSAAAGAQNTFVELSDVDTARELQKRFCDKLGLGTPVINLHTRTDRFAEVVTNLASLSSSLGEMAVNLVAWQRSEVKEVEEPRASEHHFSTTMPNKVNPELSEHVEGLATIVRGLALAMQDLQILDNRDGTRMPVEYVAIPSAYMMTSRALETMKRNIAGLIVHVDTMRSNLFHPLVQERSVAERLMIAIYRKTGERDRAYTLVHELATTSRENEVPFRAVTRDSERIAALFSTDELEALFDLTTYDGTAARQAIDAVRGIRARREGDLERR